MAEHVAEMLIRNEFGPLELALHSPLIVTETAHSWVIYGNPRYELMKSPVDRLAIARKAVVAITKADGQILRFEEQGEWRAQNSPPPEERWKPFGLSGPEAPTEPGPEGLPQAQASTDFMQWRLNDEIRRAHCRGCHPPR